jgi:hypothetical protein
LDLLEDVASLSGEAREQLLVQAGEGVHVLLAVEVKDAGDGSFALVGEGFKREAGDRAQVHGDDALLLGELVADALGHEDGFAGAGDLLDDAGAGAEVGFEQDLSGAIETEGVAEADGLPAEDEAAFGSADLEGGFEDLVEGFFG